MKSARIGLVLALVTTVAAGATAEAGPGNAAPQGADPSSEVTITDVLRLLRNNAPRVKVDRSLLKVAEADVTAAGAYPNPTLSYDVTIGLHEPAYVNGTQHQIGIEQPILIAGQHGARKDAAELGVAAARARVDADLSDRARDARTLFVALLADQDRTTVLERAVSELEHAKQVVAGRTQGGTMSQYDLLRIDVELETLGTRLSDARASSADAAGRLTTLLGLASFHPHARGSLTDLAELPQVAPANVPEVVAAKKDEESARSRIDVARRERWPTPVVGVGTMFTTHGYTLAGTLGLSLDLPLFDQGQGAIAHAAADAEVSSLTRSAVETETAAEIQRARTTLAQRKSALSQFQVHVAAALPTLATMAEDAYQSGRGTILDWIDTRRTIDDSQLALIDYEESAALAQVDLLAALGLAADAAY